VATVRQKSDKAPPAPPAPDDDQETGYRSLGYRAKRALLGPPFRTAQLSHERIRKRVALAVFSSDPISSTAYATEEMLLVLVVGGAAAVNLALPLAAGIVLLLFVAYELWGTGAYTKAQQNQLSDELSKSWTGNVTNERVRLGHGLALIRIPRLGKSFHYVIIEGVSVADLRKGPGHYPDTPLPGERGTVAIAGHRTTYGAPFRHIDELDPGDRIELRMPYGLFSYRVERTRIVPPTETSVTDRVDHDRLILSACHPLYSAAQRIIVFARLDTAVPR
jgi:sortase A